MDKLKIIIIILLIGIIAYPVILQTQYKEELIELYLNEYDDIPLNANIFNLSFGIRNRNEIALNTSVYFFQETEGSLKYIDRKNVAVLPKSNVTYEFTVSNVQKPTKYSVYIPETEQSVFLWVMPS